MISLPHPPRILEKKGNKAIFEIEPLYPGYGVTIGNSLRRVLLSSLEGSAITEVKFKGISHEFSVIPGVLEDVVIILLNLKKIRFKNFTDEPQIVTLNVKGEKKVKAGDFKLNPQIEITNPEVHIATLTSKKAELQLEAKIEKGVGYVVSEEREEKKSEVGTIQLDSIFTPVRNVSFRIENVRVEKRIDFDKLTLEIETDGTIDPEDAFFEAVDILMSHFSLFLKFGKKEKEGIGDKKETKTKTTKTKTKEKRPVSQDKKIKIEDLKISEKTKNILLKNNIKTVGGLMKKGENNLMKVEGFGKKGIIDIKKALKKLGLELN
jgi:DNA-directed RNA polymerase subunit alpha